VHPVGRSALPRIGYAIGTSSDSWTLGAAVSHKPTISGASVRSSAAQRILCHKGWPCGTAGADPRRRRRSSSGTVWLLSEDSAQKLVVAGVCQSQRIEVVDVEPPQLVVLVRTSVHRITSPLRHAPDAQMQSSVCSSPGTCSRVSGPGSCTRTRTPSSSRISRASACGSERPLRRDAWEKCITAVQPRLDRVPFDRSPHWLAGSHQCSMMVDLSGYPSRHRTRTAARHGRVDRNRQIGS